ncbi:MAG: hypothetical protein RR055_01815 [Oscillospiraceae bacterium]
MADKTIQIPVYLFTGFLESGKTRFIQETLEDKRFNAGEKTLLLVCEEGVEEYAPEQFSGRNVTLKLVSEESELTAPHLEAWLKAAGAERVVVEYNGMWTLDTLYNVLPEGWIVAQEFMFADAGTFLSYNANMRQLCYDKLKSCELVVFNRFRPDLDKAEFHKVVRGASRRTDIAYECGGKVEYDEIEDPLPFDITAPIIDIADGDYALWYRDASEEPKKYVGKTVRLTARALRRKGLQTGCFIIGRQVMTCCEADIQFAGFICNWPDSDKLPNDSWVCLTAKMDYKHHKAYGRRGPVLTAVSVSPAEPPKEVVSTFY